MFSRGFSSQSAPSTARSALAAAFLVFAIMGMTGAVATTLVPLVRRMFGLGFTVALAVQWIALVVSGPCSLPFAHLLQRQGALRATCLGLLLLALGCAAVGATIGLPATGHGQFPLVLAALGLVAAGNTCLQVAANVLVVDLGTRARASTRLTLAQGFNSLGVLAGVQLGARALAAPASEARGMAAIYLAGMALALVSLVLVVLCVRGSVAPRPSRQETGGWLVRQALASRWAIAGGAAIALYVGAEGAIGSILISFLHERSIADLPEPVAGRYVASLYWGGALAGRFLGSWLLAGRSPPHLLAAAALMASLACLGAWWGSGVPAAAAALAIGIFNSIMFPVIFATTLERSRAPAAAVSGLLTASIAGGALISIAVGRMADGFGIASAFCVPCAAYGLIAVFALRAELRTGSNALPHDSRITSSVGSRSERG